MARWGRRGSLPWMFEALISLILIALCAYTMFVYIGNNARGEQYFSKYYASDLASIAQVAAAPDGDVTVRYDNLRDDLDLGFWFTNGEVAVGRPHWSSQGLVGNRQEELPQQSSRPLDAVTGMYAKVPEYKSGTLLQPRQIVLTRSGPTMAILDSAALLDTCPVTVAPQVPKDKVAVWFELQGAATQQEQASAAAAFRETLDLVNFAVANTQAEATITIRLRHDVGSATRLTAAAGGPDATAIACDTAQQLRILTTADIAFTPNDPTAATNVVADMTLTTTNADRVSPEQMGKAAALALLRRYRS